MTQPTAKVLITGVTGCLGKHLERCLLLKGIEVVGLTRASSSLSPTHHTSHYDRSSLQSLFDSHNFAAVFHIASPTTRERNLQLIDSHIQEQVLLTEQLLACCPPTTRFIFTSSSEVYGDQAGAAHETSPLNPVSPYSFGKACTEMLIQMDRRLRGGSYTIFRLYNLFGDDLPKTHFVSQLIDALEKREAFEMTGGLQRRDFVSVDFAVETLFAALNSHTVDNQIINICRGSSISISELATHIAHHYGAPELIKLGTLPYRENEIWNMCGDPSKLLALLGKKAAQDWKAEISEWLTARQGRRQV